MKFCKEISHFKDDRKNSVVSSIYHQDDVDTSLRKCSTTLYYTIN
jgi:hypothetical protein